MRCLGTSRYGTDSFLGATCKHVRFQPGKCERPPYLWPAHDYSKPKTSAQTAMNLTIEYNDAATLAALNDFLRQTRDLSPVMAEIAERLQECFA